MIHGIILSVICIVIMPKFLGMFTGDQEVIRYGVRYASVAFLFSPIIMAGLAFEKIFQAVGRMKVSMIALLGGEEKQVAAALNYLNENHVYTEVIADGSI